MFITIAGISTIVLIVDSECLDNISRGISVEDYRAHIPEVVGAIPTPATKDRDMAKW